MHLRAETTFALARELREDGIAFVFLSGNDASALPEDLRSSRILAKPLLFDELLKIVEASPAVR